MQTLRRTPLYERHVAAGARMVPFAGWEMPVQYEGVIDEHRAVRERRRGLRRLAHGRARGRGPDRARPAAVDSSRTTSTGSRSATAQYTLLTTEDGGIVDDLIVYRLDAHRYLLVVNASNREADFRWLQERELRGSDVRDVSDDYALLAVQGPQALDRLGLEHGRAFTWSMASIDGVEVMVNRTGYTGEEGVELACMADDAAALWDAVVARGVVPCGLGARDTLRLEVCYPLHGNDIGPQWDAISSGLGWACALDTEFTGAERLREIKASGPEQKLVAFRDDREGDPPPGHGDRGRRRGHLGLALADARRRDRPRLRAGAARGDREPSWSSTCAGAPAHGEIVKKPIYKREESTRVGRERVVSRGSALPPRARLGADRRRRGRARGHLVRPGRARRARALRAAGRRARRSPRTRSYGEVESVKAVSDLISPLSGEVLEVNQQVVDAPELVNEDPYGAGWLIRIRLSSPGERDAAARRRDDYRKVIADQ